MVKPGVFRPSELNFHIGWHFLLFTSARASIRGYYHTNAEYRSKERKSLHRTFPKPGRWMAAQIRSWSGPAVFLFQPALLLTWTILSNLHCSVFLIHPWESRFSLADLPLSQWNQGAPRPLACPPTSCLLAPCTAPSCEPPPSALDFSIKCPSSLGESPSVPCWEVVIATNNSSIVYTYFLK